MLFHKYSKLQSDIKKINAELDKYDKDNEEKLRKLQKQNIKYDKYFEGKQAPRHTLENRKKICEFLEIDYDDFCKYIKSEKLGRYWLYDAVIFYILDCIDKIQKQRKILVKKIEKSISEIKFEMQPIIKQLTEVYSTYELSEYLDVDYKLLINTDFTTVAPMEAILNLKQNHYTFIPICDFERTTETLADLVFLTKFNYISWREPIKEMTYEIFIESSLESRKNEINTVNHYFTQTY